MYICAVYRTSEEEGEEGWVLPVVRSVEKQMAADVTLNHESFSEAGLFDFRLAGIRLLLGKDNVALIQNRVIICVVFIIHIGSASVYTAFYL